MAIDKSDRLKPYHFLAGVVSFGPSPCGLEGWPGTHPINLFIFVSNLNFIFRIPFVILIQISFFYLYSGVYTVREKREKN